VISHEEYATAPAARVFGIPVLFITDYFLPPHRIWMQSLAYADRIIVIDEPGHFNPPSFLRERIVYSGLFVRRVMYDRTYRASARTRMGIPYDASVIMVLPGSWFTETRAPIFELVRNAFERIPAVSKLLIWIAGGDYAELATKTLGLSDIRVQRSGGDVDLWMALCDLAITKGTRKTSPELGALGTPFIILSPCLNPIDDRRVRAISLGEISYLTRDLVEELTQQMSLSLREGQRSHWRRRHRPSDWAWQQGRSRR
jgi:UDP-N-acetylglucosamine:LPS N-acetylglucosamine transferase